jgi:hypothetical protein
MDEQHADENDEDESKASATTTMMAAHPKEVPVIVALDNESLACPGP